MFRRTVLKLQHRFFLGGVWTRKKQHSPVAHGINLALMMEANQPFAVVFDRGASLSWWIWRIKELGPSDSHESYARLSTDRRPKEKRGIVALKAFKVLQVPKFKESLQRVWVCINRFIWSIYVRESLVKVVDMVPVELKSMKISWAPLLCTSSFHWSNKVLMYPSAI